jgi:hypothetical protein
MIIGILGNIGDHSPVSQASSRPSACGNGKTMLNAYLGYSEYERNPDRKIIANFHTKFMGMEMGTPSWAEYMTAQEIFEIWLDVEKGDEYYGAWVMLTEVSSLINSKARNGKLITYVEKCLNQRRKDRWTVVWDSQDLGAADKTWRDKTDYIYRPKKFHCTWNPEYKIYVPTEPCPLDICDQRHQIVTFIESSPEPLTALDLITPQLDPLNTWTVGQLYDTDEKMKDVLQWNPEWAKGL